MNQGFRAKHLTQIEFLSVITGQSPNEVADSIMAWCRGRMHDHYSVYQFSLGIGICQLHKHLFRDVGNIDCIRHIHPTHPEAQFNHIPYLLLRAKRKPLTASSPDTASSPGTI